ncbi:MAG: hypothetical protein H6974_09420 [Gammaproteobacteria bacterium]|nr:hypothetical protein [Gammaproteobacteria bacterium]
MATATPQAPQDPSSVPPASPTAKTEPTPPPAPATASAAPTPEPVTTPAPATAPSAAELDAAVQAGIQADRVRVKSIRAAFAPWTKRGYDLSALLSACEEGGDDLPTAHTKLLTQLGQMAEPLAVGQGAPETREADLAAAQRKLLNQVAGKG